MNFDPEISEWGNPPKVLGKSERQATAAVVSKYR